MKPGIAYRIITQELPPPSHSYEFILAGNGVFIRAAKSGLLVQFPLAYCPIRGLSAMKPYFNMEAPRVPCPLVEELVSAAMAQTAEILFYLNWEQDHWQLAIPSQAQDLACVTPNEIAGEQYRHALIECHSHGSMKAFFSQQDDRDEQGFRLYAVLGNLREQPTLKTRVGVFGYFWDVPSTAVFELPPGVKS